MASRQAILSQVLTPGLHGQASATPQLVFQEKTSLILHQVAAWPETVTAIEQQLVNKGGYSSAPGLSSAIINQQGEQLVRIEPLKWWLLGHEAPELDASVGVTLDLSHARVQVNVSGQAVRDYLNRFLPVDLRESRCPPGRVYTTQLHHASVTLIHCGAHFCLLLPTGFAVSLMTLLCEGAEQFGYEVLPSAVD